MRSSRAAVGYTSRTVTGWITRHPDKLSAREREELNAILERCSDLATTAQRVRAFAVMMRERAGERLNSWMRAVPLGHGR